MTVVEHNPEGLDDLAYKLRTAGCTSDSIEMRFDTRMAFELAARLDKVDALDRREAALKAAFTDVVAAQVATKQALAMVDLRTRQWGRGRSGGCPGRRLLGLGAARVSVMSVAGANPFGAACGFVPGSMSALAQAHLTAASCLAARRFFLRRLAGWALRLAGQRRGAAAPTLCPRSSLLDGPRGSLPRRGDCREGL